MALTRLDNLISSKTGKYLYVSPDDFNATDELNNRGNSPIRPFKSIQRAFLEIARYSYLPGPDNDRFDQFTIMLMPGNHYIDNRPGIVDTNGIDPFAFDQAMNLWTDNSNLDISDPNNVLYLFNNTEGGAILPRGSSLVGYDLRRTVVRPLYVPDPADRLEKRSAIFNVTGACYFWQFTIKDGDLEPSSPLFDKTDGIGKVYYQNGYWDQKAVPNYSHHKLTVFEYADKEELGLYYQKIAKAFSQYQPTIDDPREFSERIEENRIVGPLSDFRSIESIKLTDSSPAGTISVEVTSKVNHGYFKNQFVAIENNGLDDQLNGAFSISEIDLVDQRKFTYKIPGTVAALGTNVSLVSGTTYTSQNGLSSNAIVKAEVDSVESASPYVFNCSIRSTWGICGIWANGLKATGFKSMVIAQYTGVSLQKDDRAFIRYDEYSNTFNQASLADAFATTPYHTKGDAFWKDDWRNFHVRASEDAFIQNVSIFAVGFADHFLMESGGDMSITNSNSNFGNTSLHAIGHKGFAFSQDKGGYVTDIIPPKVVDTTSGNIKRSAYYTLDVPATKNQNTATDQTKIYLGDDEGYNPRIRPAASIDGFRLGARSDEKLYVKLIPRTAGGSNIFNATLSPNGFKKFTASADILNPSGITINHKNLDAADRIEDNKLFIAEEAYGYITNKYPYLLDKQGITIEKCRRDIGYLIDATVQDLRLGGNINTIQAAESYYVGNSLSYIIGELTETLEGYDYARDLAIAAMRNFSYLRTGTSTTASSAIVDIGDTSGVVQGMRVADYDPSQFTDGSFNNGATRPASPVIPNDTYVKRVVSSTEIELGQKATYSTKKLVGDRNGDARNLILTNKNFIAREAYDRMVLDFPGFTTPTGNSQDCIDDIVDVIEAVAENLAYGGNDEVWDAAYLYESGAHVAGEEAQTVKAFEYARDMAIQVMRNEDVFIYGTHGLTQTKDTSITYVAPELVQDRNGDARDLILANKNLIANEAVERMLAKYPTFTVPGGNINCIDDVVDLLEAVADNLAYGGNDKTFDAAYSYVKGAHVSGEELQTLYVFEQARLMAAQVMRNQKVLITGAHGLSQTFDTTITYNAPDSVTDRGGDARNLILANKTMIANEAYARMIANNPSFVPPTGNTQDCVDDIADLVEEVAYNTAFGGNDRVWEVADLYLTGAHVAGEESQTIEAFNHARDIMVDVMRNQKVLLIGAGGSNRAADAKNLMISNRNLIAAEAYARMLAENPGFTTPTGDPQDCIDDIVDFVNEISYNVAYGGNDKTWDMANLYVQGAHVAGEEAQTVKAFEFALSLMTMAMRNEEILILGTHGFTQVYDTSITVNPATPINNKAGDARNLVLSNKDFIAEIALGRMLAQYPAFNVPTGNNNDCLDDIKDVIDVVAHNLAYGGNDRTWDAANYYATGAHVTGEETETIYAFNQARDMMIQAMRNETITVGGHTGLTQVIDSSITTDTNTPRCANEAASITTLVNILTSSITSQGTYLYNVTRTNSVSSCDDIQSSIATLGQIVVDAVTTPSSLGSVTKTASQYRHGYTQTFDNSITYDLPDPLVDRNGDARNLIVANKAFIGAEAYERMLAENPGFVSPSGNAQDCIDDIKDFAEEISYNLAFGGNDRTWDMSNLYVTGAHVVGEETQTVQCFEYARDIMVQIMRNEDVLVTGSHGLSQTKDTTITYNEPTPVNNKSADAKNLILANTNFIAEIAFGRMQAANAGFTVPTNNNADCIDDIKDIIKVVAHNLAFGGNDRTWDAANLYATGAHVAGEEAQTIQAFNEARDIMIEVMRNEDVTVGGHTSLTQVKDLTITVDQASPTCQQQEATITSLVLLLTNTINSGTSLYSVTRTFSQGPCDDVRSAITTLAAIPINAVTTPASLAGVTRTVSAGSCEDVRSSITTLTQIVTDTIAGNITLYDLAKTASEGSCEDTRVTINTLFKIVEDAVATPTSLGSVTRTISNGSCQDIASGITTLFKLLTDTIENPGYIDSVARNPVPLGLEFGPSINANSSSTNSYLYFTLDAGVYSSTTPTTDETITQHTTYPECVDQASTIRQYFANISTIIQTGLASVARTEPPTLTTELAARATVWTLDNNGSNPHNLETGTAVRLVPRPRYDTVTNQYVDVDKRLVRLPNGFETNEKYYIIAPGRTTKPEDYSSVGAFDGSDQTKIMLASSKENAAAGIYIHSAEVEDIHPDVEIDIYNFVLDDNYDLHQYSCELDGVSNTNIRTDVPHIFDVPFPNITGHTVFFRANEGGQLPLVGSAYASDPTVADGNGRILGNVYFFARYINEKVFTIYKTKSDAEAGVNEITFQPGTYDFSVFANKRESPMKFDPAFTNPGTAPVIYGKWYLQTENDLGTDQIIGRIREYADGIDKTNDSYFERVKDERDALDRIYRLRYVIPSYLQSARDPINGFTIKTRTDETRKLVPQRLVLKPVSGNVTKARFFNPVQSNEVIGVTKSEFETLNLNPDVEYDPYRKDLTGTTQYAKKIETQNYVTMTIESGRYFTAPDNNDYLELNVINPEITNAALINETFTTIKVTAPQGGNFVADKTQSSDAVNRVEWFGNSSGYGYLHAITNVPGTSDWYMILKGVVGALTFDTIENIRIGQGAAFSDLLADPDFGKSLVIKELIRKNYPEYYYRQNGAPVYTVTPGDVIEDDAGIQYYIESVTDTGVIDDTFYIFDVEEVQRRIFGQQDGIYYLTAVRGNISPFPQGAGNLGNFRNFKFSQPISKLYPLNYKNDPLWYQKLDATLVDPPATYSAADNYVHGLVRVNDFKGSMTKEAMIDLLATPALEGNSYTQVSSTVDNRLIAQEGNAASGSEDRKIPIAGDSTVMSDQRYYVELRRPSIARAGNHTFEYLGFGPGNYSTGLPARQEVVLTATQDFYAQSKKQDGGLVFYTGLNSNGDLYIGNRKIDAITGEEEFLESATLQDSADDDETLGNLVTTFDTPVTFNEYITVNGGEAQDRRSTFNSPVLINVLGTVREAALTISSFVDPAVDDGSLDRNAFLRNQETEGDIVIARNKISAAIFQFNSRRDGQPYKIQTHIVGTSPSNMTPDQTGAFNAAQIVQYGSAGAPLAGDMLLKGESVGQSGSLGWIYANFFTEIGNTNIYTLTFNNTNIVTIEWGGSLTNDLLGITSGSEIRILGMTDSQVDGTWQVIANGFSGAANTVQIAINNVKNSVQGDNPRLWADEVAANANITMEFSNSNWKEFGVLGAEAIRTNTAAIGDYKLGVNTVARSERDSYETNFIDANTTPRANLDVVGTAFISGKKVTDYASHSVFANRTQQDRTDALMVGGDAYTPANEATFRVSTADGGRVGINVTNAELDRALVVDGESRFTGDARFQEDIEVHGGGGSNTAEIRTDITSGNFDIIPDSTFTGALRIAPQGTTLRMLNDSQSDQFLYFGNSSLHSNIWIGNTPHDATNISKVTIGGAYGNNESLSFTQIGTKSLKVDGDFQLGTKRGLLDTVRLSSTAGKVEFFAGNSATSILDFATNASQITIGGQGGSTRIRNQLVVDSTSRFNADMTLCGGFASYSFVASRAQAGSNRIAHPTGILGNNLFNSNVDLIDVNRFVSGDPQYNEVDTSGSGNWGGNSYQDAITNIGGNPAIEPQDLPALTGNQYYLPLLRESLDDNGVPYFQENDILLIDSPDSSAASVSETNFSTYTDGNAPQGIIAEVIGGVDIAFSGPGTGSTGGFNTGQKYLAFHTTSGPNYFGPRYATFTALDASFLNATGPVTSIEIDVHVGNNVNGGELPDAPNEGLQVRYSIDGGTTFTSAGFIAPDDLTDNDPASWPTFVRWIDQSKNYCTLQLDIPVDSQVAGVQFQLFQEVISGSDLDNYGITNFRYNTTNVGSNVEFVRVVSLPRISVAPYYLVVEREPFGTFTGVSNAHPDRTAIYKCIVQFDATWTEQPIDDVGNDENVYLAQFGGSIAIADYVIIGRESSANNAVFDIGEVFKVKELLSQVAKKFMIKNGCDTNSEDTVYEVDSTTGAVTAKGDQKITGSLTLGGSCTTPFTNSATNNKLTITNGSTIPITTFEVDTCTGDTEIGNVHGTVFFVAEAFGTSPAAYTADVDECTVYRFDPQSDLATGPITTLPQAIVAATSNIQISSNIDAFMKGDLVALYVTDSQIEIIQITDTPYTNAGLFYLPTSSNAEYTNGGRGVEGTTAQDFAAGVNVVKLEKYERKTTLLHDLPATQSDRATEYKARTPNTSDLRLELTLRDADLVSPKLDYFTMMRIGTEFFVADSVDGSLDAFYAVKMSKQIRYPNNVGTELVNLFGGGNVTIHQDVEIYSGALRMYGSDGKTLVMAISNDDGHSGDGSIEDPKTNTNGLTLKGPGTFYGDLKVYYDDCQMNGICSTETSFRVSNREGNVFMGESFYQKGKVRENELASEVIFHVDNLGSAGQGGTEGAKDFRIYHNNAIDSFGIEKYWTGNGGRRQTYVAFDPSTGIGQQQDNPLEVNNNYLVNASSGSNMVLYLPDNAQTGDMIRFVELSGNLTYNTSLIIRALKIDNTSVPIQGDNTGSRIGAGAGQTLTTTWDSGELIIQSRNASFGLVYAGVVDIEGSANARTIPPSLRGWWLMEL